jgi:hypothetical protein
MVTHCLSTPHHRVSLSRRSSQSGLSSVPLTVLEPGPARQATERLARQRAHPRTLRPRIESRCIALSSSESRAMSKRSAGPQPAPRWSALGGFFYSAAAHASSADEDSPDTATDHGTHFLKVRPPSPLGPVVGVANIVSDRRLFSAKGTVSHCHRVLLVSRQIP